MICKQCGRDNPEGGNFCMGCGVALNALQDEIENTQEQNLDALDIDENQVDEVLETESDEKLEECEVKSNKTISLIVLIVIGILVTFLVGTRDSNDLAFTFEEMYDDYTEINEQALEIESKYAVNGSIQPEKLSDVLREIGELAEKGCSKGVIASYEIEETGVYIEFKSGIGYLYTPTVEEMLSGDELGQILTIEPYANNYEFVGNYLLGGKSPDKAANTVVSKLPGQYSFSEENNWDSVSLEQIAQMGGKDIILWYGHGGYTKKHGSVLGTSISIHEGSIGEYNADLFAGDMILGKHYFCVCPSYFENNIAPESLAGSLVFLNACESAKDERLANVFIDKGAALVVGNSNTIRIRYMLYMMDDFVTALTNQYEDESYWTAEDALLYAKKQNGDRDSKFVGYGAEVKLIYPEGESEYCLCDQTTADLNETPEDSDEPSTQEPTDPNFVPIRTYSMNDGAVEYELVIFQYDAYPDSTFTFGVMKDGEWIVESSSDCPFIDEDGRWKARNKFEDNLPYSDDFVHIGGPLILYKCDSISQSSIVYNVETGVYFENLCNRDYTEIDNYTQFLGYESGTLKLTCFNTETGEKKIIGGELEKARIHRYLDISEGLFYLSLDDEERSCGFYNLEGNKVIDLSEYKITDLHGGKFNNGKFMMTCQNSSGVEYDITIDKQGNVVEQKKTAE